MRALLRIVLLSVCAAGVESHLLAAPLAGSALPADQNACAQCHCEAGVWDANQARLFVSKESLAQDVHFLKGVNCHDCHGGNPASLDVPVAHATVPDKSDPKVLSFRMPLSEVRKSCAKCHEEPWKELTLGMHAQAKPNGVHEHAAPGACSDCHGKKVHGMLPVQDRRSPVYRDNQVRLCGDCHPKSLDSYSVSVHGRGLWQSGLSVVAVCADCHGAHGVYRATSEQSGLHPGRVAATCGKCHGGIEECWQNGVHGRAEFPGRKSQSASAKASRKPSCTDCHQGHDLPDPKSANARLALADRCGNCHADLSAGYAISMHGALTALGYGPAAKCSDCHGSHDILPVSDSRSTLSAGNRRATCEKCHPGATKNFVDFDPHADHRDSNRDPVLHGVYLVLMTLLLATFGSFGLHSLLWFIRGLVDVLRHGRPRSLVPGTVAYVRFGPFHRVAHMVMILSFLGLALTGLPLKYSSYGWAGMLANAFGGFESTGHAHRIFAVVNIGCLVVYVFRLLGRLLAGPSRGGSRIGMIFGPDSPVPNLRDVKDVFKMIRWFFGLGPKPTFERWTYWEKFDFWGACADIVIIGATGLILWFPDLVCAFLPGKVLNIAKVIHSTQALLATGFVFAIHFFNTHMRPEKFPMDMSILTGRVSEEELQEERPEYLERMRREGKLAQLQSKVPPREVLALAALGGTVALFAGLGLLAGIVLAALGG